MPSTQLYDVTRPNGEFLMRASLRGLALFIPIDGSACGRVVVEQKVRQQKEPTLVVSCGVPPQEFLVKLATSPCESEIDER